MDIDLLIAFEIRILCRVIPGSPPSVAPREDEAGTNVAAMITATSVRLEQLNVAHPDDFVAALPAIYDHSPWIAGAVTGARPFASLPSVNDAMAAHVPAQPTAQR